MKVSKDAASTNQNPSIMEEDELLHLDEVENKHSNPQLPEAIEKDDLLMLKNATNQLGAILDDSKLQLQFVIKYSMVHF